MPIKFLTEQQKERMADLGNLLLAKELCPEPTDRTAAEDACAAIYSRAGLAPPKRFLWCESPLSAFWAAFLLLGYRAPVRGVLGTTTVPPSSVRFGSTIAQQVIVNMNSCLEDAFGSDRYSWANQAGALLWDPIYHRLWRGAWKSVLNEIDPDVRVAVYCRWDSSELAALRRGVRQYVLDQISDDIRNCGDVPALVSNKEAVSWRITPYYAMLAGLGLDLSPIRELLFVGKHCTWWWPFETTVILAEQPIRIEVNDRLEFHCHDAAALAYRDGWGIYAIHNIRVPARIFLTPESISVNEILEERNVEIRRIMIERLGLDRFLTRAEAKIIDVDQDGKRRLYRIALRRDEPIVAVRVQCPSTGQIYFLRVPPNIQTCRQAVAWTFWYDNQTQCEPAKET